MKELFVIALIAALVKVNLINKDNDSISYQKDILPIIQLRCAMCHNNSTPERNWLDYKTAFNKKDSIKLRLENRSMPLGITMLESERQLMIEWVKQGAKK